MSGADKNFQELIRIFILFLFDNDFHKFPPIMTVRGLVGNMFIQWMGIDCSFYLSVGRVELTDTIFPVSRVPEIFEHVIRAHVGIFD